MMNIHKLWKDLARPYGHVFVKNDGINNYIVVRSAYGHSGSYFGKGYKFDIALAQGNRIEQIGTLTVEYPKQLKIKRWF